jgi:tetratricopeptide (TPR) repeat protein
MDAIELGGELKVDGVLVGTIQTEAKRLRVNVRLIDVRDGAVIWTDVFEEPENDIFKLQDAISARVAHSVLGSLTKDEMELLAKRSTSNKDAYRNYLIGQELFLRRDGNPQALGYFKMAAKLDPDFALAYLGIADYQSISGEVEKAEENLEKAIKLDPELHEALATKAFGKMFHYWQWKEAEDLLRQAAGIAPNSAKVHHWYGVNLCLQRRFSEAIVKMNRALELDPTSLLIATDIAEIQYFMNDLNGAETKIEEILKIDPEFDQAQQKRSWIRNMKYGSFFGDKLRNELNRLKSEVARGVNTGEQNNKRIRHYEGVIQRGDKNEMFELFRKDLGGLNRKDPNLYWSSAGHFAVAGRSEEALRMLEQSLGKKEFMLPYINVDPIWNDTRENPRFQHILKSMNLAGD